MGELGLNKIFGALLAVVLVIMGLREVSGMVFSTGGDYHHGEEKPVNEWAKKFAYSVPIAETAPAGGEVIEEIYDLGLLLASADVSRGERTYKAQCASCHSIEQGGANGTGPNLYNKLGAAKQSNASFSYSGALAQTEGDWSWENMDAWLENPSSYARGTSMAYAGLRRDDQRAAVLLYLASNSSNTPPAPEPLPAVEEASVGVLESGDLEMAIESTDGELLETEATDPAVEMEEASQSAADIVDAEVSDAVEAATDQADATVQEVVDATVEATEEIIEDATGE